MHVYCFLPQRVPLWELLPHSKHSMARWSNHSLSILQLQDWHTTQAGLRQKYGDWFRDGVYPKIERSVSNQN